MYQLSNKFLIYVEEVEKLFNKIYIYIYKTLMTQAHHIYRFESIFVVAMLSPNFNIINYIF